MKHVNSFKNDACLDFYSELKTLNHSRKLFEIKFTFTEKNNDWLKDVIYAAKNEIDLINSGDIIHIWWIDIQCRCIVQETNSNKINSRYGIVKTARIWQVRVPNY